MFARHKIALLALALTFSVPAFAQEKEAAKETGPAPKLVIDSLSHNFGEVKAGKSLTHTFKVKNRGNADLEIVKVEPG